MKISTRLNIASVIPACMAIVIIAALVVSYQDMGKIQTTGEAIRHIRSDITGLNHIVFSYVLYHEDRPKQQFQAGYTALVPLIAGTHVQTPEQQLLLESVHQHLTDVNELFIQLVVAHESNIAAGPGVEGGAEDRLSGLLMIKSHEADADAALLGQDIDESLRLSQVTTFTLILIVIIVSAIAVSVVLMRTRKSITTNLKNLTSGAAVIGSGNLDFKIAEKGNDEITDLSRAFNRMTSSLVKANSDVELELKARKEAEMRVTNLNSILKVLRNINQLIVHENDRQRLIQKSCDMITEMPGYKFAIIILVDKAQRLVATALSSAEKDFADRPSEQFKSSQILKNVSDFLLPRNETVAICPHEERQKQGWPFEGHHDKAASIAALLRHEGRVYGAMSIDIPRDTIVQEETLDLFRELAGDIAFALAAIEARESHAKTERDLWKSEASLAEAQRLAAIGSWDLDIVSNKLTWSDEVYRIFNLQPQQFEANYEALLSNIHPDDRDMVNNAYTESVKNNTPYDIVHRLLMSDGTVKFVNERCRTFYNDSGEPIRSIGTVQDITEKHQAEARLAKAAEEWSATFNSFTDLVSIHHSDFTLARVNKSFAVKFGESPDELLGKHCYAIVHGTNEPPLFCPFKQVINTKKEESSEFIEPKIGTIEVTCTPLLGESGDVTGCAHVIRDVTEKKKVQEQLMLSDRLASIGQMVSGIAHELNNPLTSIIGFSEMLTQADLPKRASEDIQIINQEARRTSDIVKGLLTFARKKGVGKIPEDVNAIVQSVLKLRAHEHKVNNIAVEAQYSEGLPQVMANVGQLQQVFINLIVNAEQAMIEAHQRGTLNIKTEEAGGMVIISFRDDGPGIAQKNMVKIFTPFFTTKGVGKGTGLGLSTCHGIISEHGGRIHAESEYGKGATFVVELPAISDAPPS